MNPHTICLFPSPNEENATPSVVSALAELKQVGGGILRFEKGDYHFYEDGTERIFYAVSNNSAGEKKIVFSLRDMDGITVDGNGSRFIIHGRIFPFAVDRCQNVTIKNIYFDRDVSPHISLRVRNVTKEGFGLEIDRKKVSFYVEDGSLSFIRPWGEVSGKTSVLSLHSADRIRVRYLLTGDCSARYDHLPTAFMWADATETEWGVNLTCRSVDGAQPCLYEEGEHLSLFLDGGRENDLLFFTECESVRIENVTVRQAMGMGIIAQLCRNITVKGLRTEYDESVGGVTFTADAMHFVNCDGDLEISDCHVTHSEDDILNVHGIYTLLDSADKDSLSVKLMHHEQRGFCPYRHGDLLRLIDQSDMGIVGKFRVDSYAIEGKEKDRIRLMGAWEHGDFPSLAGKIILVENPSRMPNLHLHHNTFFHFPHLRISGGGNILVEHNHLEQCKSAALLMDLAVYWYESGRIRNLVFRKNKLVDCNALGVPNGFIQIGVSGFENQDAPKIHERIEISDNEFIGVKNRAITAGGVKELILRDNKSDSENGLSICIDGKDLP